jgi:hypothetical protein
MQAIIERHDYVLGHEVHIYKPAATRPLFSIDRSSYSTMQNRCRKQLAIGIKSCVRLRGHQSIWVHDMLISTRLNHRAIVKSQPRHQVAVKPLSSNEQAIELPQSCTARSSTHIPWHADSSTRPLLWFNRCHFDYARGLEFKDGRSNLLALNHFWWH